MGKPRRDRNLTQGGRDSGLLMHDFDRPPREKRIVTLTARTDAQKAYIRAITTNDLTFGLGPAGTGKTFVASFLAGQAFEDNKCEKIIVTRPAIEAGEELGFLPGLLEEKVAPYFAPVRDALERKLGKGRVDYMLKAEQLIFCPLAYMRGRTFDDAFVLLDEAQNTTPAQMKMFLTRVGERTRLVVNGDLLQSDIPGANGLADATQRFDGYAGIGKVTFSRDDVVRSGLARVIVDAYEGEPHSRLPRFITGDNDSEQGRMAG